MSKLSIIIPVYYNADTLVDCYEDLKKNALDGFADDYELIFVDDGSGDDSWEICKQLAGKDNNVRLVKLSRNFGSHAAIYAGLSICTGDCATVKAADCQEPSSLILDMYSSWKQGPRVVLAVRDGREEGFFKKLFANMYYGLTRRYVNKKMPKKGFDTFLIDRKVIEVLKLLDERNSAITLQVLWTGFKTATVPYKRVDRKKGKSRWSLSKRMRLTVDSFVSFSPAPIRLIQIISTLFMLAAVVWSVLIVIWRLVGDIPIQGWTTLMIVVLFSSGLIMLSLGILGEYIWRNLDVAHNRPVFIIDEEERELVQSEEDKT